MKKLSSTEAELKENVAYKKQSVYRYFLFGYMQKN